MKRRLLLSTAVFTAALALGCADQQSPTAPANKTPSSPSPSFAQTGSGGGAVVTRGTLGIGLFFTDEERGLTTQIGVTFAEMAGVCAGTSSGPPVSSFLEVDKPTGAVKLLLKNKQIPVVVWQLVSLDFCGVLATTTPYAEGTARLHLEDNHANPFPIEPGANASSLHAQGTVTVLDTGEELHYQAIFHLVLPPGSTSFDDIHVLRSEILLH